MDDALTFVGTRSSDAQTTTEGDSVALGRAPLTRGTTLGRYLIIEQIGEGGMGVVVRAYDPKLHREIALKRLHRGALDSDGEARLMREAQAMARLSHPNVVTIYDVERTDEGVVMAMEYAEGQTLAQWISDGPHPWPLVLERFEQAGRGLQAAHDAGLIHRDFKPSNAIVGPQGRVRVMDFGLARSARGVDPQSLQVTELDGEMPDQGSDSTSGSQPEIDLSGSGSLSMQLTQAGAVMGTPAYMSTEQHRGETADASSDQYAFCVSLWEALWNERPFHGPSRGIVLAKHHGPPSMPRGSRVPRHIYEALRRGLNPRATARWPSIAALLEALGDDPVRRRRRWLVAGAGLVLTGGLGTAAVLAWPQPGAPPCQDAPQLLVGTWDDDRKAEVRTALQGTELSYADPTWARVSERLDAYARDWVHMHTEACEATAVRKVQSEALLDLRMQCLRRRRLHLAATIDVLAQADSTVASKAIQQVAGLPPLDRCADTEALTAAVPPPEQPEVARAVEHLRDELTRVDAQVAGGRYDQARAALAELLERSHALDYPPVEAQVLNTSASLARLQGRYDRSVEEASRGYELALRSGADVQAARAAYILTYVTGNRQAKPEVGWAWSASARALAQRTDPTGVEEAMVINATGVLAYRDGDFARATQHFERALAILEDARDDDDSIATTLNHLGAMLDEQGRYTEAEPHFRRALAIHTAVFGLEHPRRTLSMDNLALCLQAQGRNDEARDLHLEALELRTRALGREHPDVGLTENNLGWDYMGMDDLDKALEHFSRARATFEAAYGAEHPRVAMALESLALAQTKRERYTEAEALHRRSMEIRRAALGDDHPNVALSLSGLGSLAYEQGRYEEAIDKTKQALAIVESREGTERYTSDIVTALGKALLAAERFTEARSELERALAIRERGDGVAPAVLATLHLYLAQATWGEGQPEQARARARRGLEALADHQGESVDQVRAQLQAWLAERP